MESTLSRGDSSFRYLNREGPPAASLIALDPISALALPLRRPEARILAAAGIAPFAALWAAVPV